MANEVVLHAHLVQVADECAQRAPDATTWPEAFVIAAIVASMAVMVGLFLLGPLFIISRGGHS